MLLVKKYFCFELVTTGLLVGWLGLAESVSSFISSIVLLVKYDDYFTKDNFPNTNLDKMGPAIISILATSIAVNLVDILATSLLIVGTIKRNRLCLLPWLINNGFSILFSFVVSISVLGILSSNSDNVGTVVLVFIILFVTMNFYIYTWIAIYSLYNLIRRSQPNNEYTSLIEDSGATGNPIYTRA